MQALRALLLCRRQLPYPPRALPPSDTPVSLTFHEWDAACTRRVHAKDVAFRYMTRMVKPGSRLRSSSSLTYTVMADGVNMILIRAADKATTRHPEFERADAFADFTFGFRTWIMAIRWRPYSAWHSVYGIVKPATAIQNRPQRSGNRACSCRDLRVPIRSHGPLLVSPQATSVSG